MAAVAVAKLDLLIQVAAAAAIAALISSCHFF